MTTQVEAVSRFPSWVAIRRALSASGLIVAAGMAVGQPAAKKSESIFEPSALEVTRLPPYCWGQFNPQLRGPGMNSYNLPPGCGWKMNHYCPGLVALGRAKSDVRRSRFWLGVAQGELRYTINGLKQFPNCPLIGDVQKYMREVEALSRSPR